MTTSGVPDSGRSGGEGTGLHVHGHPEFGQIVCDDRGCRAPGNPSTPVILLDPVTARDTIARAIWASDMAGGLSGGVTFESDTCRDDYYENADAVLAALASQERGDG